MKRQDFLHEARNIVCNDREGQYGSPEDNFAIIADLWTAYTGAELTSEDVAAMMCLLKLARIKTGMKFKSDSWVDAIGYLACGGEVAFNLQDELDRLAEKSRHQDYEIIRDGEGRIYGLRDMHTGKVNEFERVGGQE